MIPTISEPIPVRMYTAKALEFAGVSHQKWKQLQDEGRAPRPAYRGKGGYVYRGIDIARFMGLVDDTERKAQNDPFKKGLEGIGRIKR